MIVGTAGHIDHGKTSLVGKLTGVDTDRLKEEKARGLLGAPERRHRRFRRRAGP
jgi:translation initiation factor 2 gamma subunit (eIF-2gamma)